MEASEAAEKMGVTARRLYAMKKTSPWWRPEFKTDDGWDVDAMMAAQLAYATQASSSADKGWKDRENEAKAKIRELELEDLQFDADLRRGNILPADVYASYSRELLGMIRKRLEEIPLRVARNASPAGRAVVYNPKGNAPLQREIEKLITDVEEWLKKPPEGDENAAN